MGTAGAGGRAWLHRRGFAAITAPRDTASPYALRLLRLSPASCRPGSGSLLPWASAFG